MGLVGSTGGLCNDDGNHKGNNSKKNSQVPPSQQPSSPRELPKPDPNYSPAKLLEKYEHLRRVTLPEVTSTFLSGKLSATLVIPIQKAMKILLVKSMDQTAIYSLYYMSNL